ncbi:hypothetical protein ACCO45_009896 [Purpureocillium lilacinum]|uniref:Uncharacterized protein n=1 Tax=Purpureocillium lilacinum TaxID=33203 RepID=A0ACC4DJ40_PURLI
MGLFQSAILSALAVSAHKVLAAPAAQGAVTGSLVARGHILETINQNGCQLDLEEAGSNTYRINIQCGEFSESGFRRVRGVMAFPKQFDKHTKWILPSGGSGSSDPSGGFWKVDQVPTIKFEWEW